MSKLGSGVEEAMILAPSMYLDDNSAYPRRLRTSLSKLMDKQLDHNINVLPIGQRSRSNSFGEGNAAPITSVLRSASPIRHGTSTTGGLPVKPPKMFKKEYLLKNNNCSQVLKGVGLVSNTRSTSGAHNNKGYPSNSGGTMEHKRGLSYVSQFSGSTQVLESESPKLGGRIHSSDSFTSSSPTVAVELDSQFGGDENNTNNKRHSILSNFMNDEQMWLDDKDGFRYFDDSQFDKDKIELTIKKLELQIDELKLDNDKLHLEKDDLSSANRILASENDSLIFQNHSLIKHIQSLPRISTSDFLVRKAEKEKDKILDSLQFKSDVLLKAAVEGKIKELEKELAKYKQIQRVTASNLSPRKNKFKYLSVDQLDDLLESENEQDSQDKEAEILNIDNLTTTEESSDESNKISDSTRLKHGFNLRIKLTSIPSE